MTRYRSPPSSTSGCGHPGNAAVRRLKGRAALGTRQLHEITPTIVETPKRWPAGDRVIHINYGISSFVALATSLASRLAYGVGFEWPDDDARTASGQGTGETQNRCRGGPLIKPFDVDTVLAEIDTPRPAVNLENHSIIGGLFDTVAGAMVQCHVSAWCCHACRADRSARSVP